MACANVATNSPTANWLGLSLRKFWTIRGENWPIANCTTTMVIVRTRAASDTIDAAIVSRMASGRVGITGHPPRDGVEAERSVRAERGDGEHHAR